jgi:hypothetical protein
VSECWLQRNGGGYDVWDRRERPMEDVISKNSCDALWE